VYVPPLLNAIYQFGKDKFTLPVPALNVRVEQTPGNLNTKKHILAKGLSQVVRRLVANGTMWLDRYFLSISMSSPLPLSSLRYVDGGNMNLSFHLPVVLRSRIHGALSLLPLTCFHDSVLGKRLDLTFIVISIIAS